MATWALYHTMTRLDTGARQHLLLEYFDDTQITVTQAMANRAGSDWSDFQASTPEDGVIEAKVQYTPDPNRDGWIRDNEVDYDYVVMFTAVRQPPMG